MTAGNWIAIAVPFLGLVVGGLLYVVQKYLDRQHEIHRERRVLYREFVKSFSSLKTAIQRAIDSENSFYLYTELDSVLSELAVTAPDPVVQAFDGIREKLIDSAQYAHKKGRSDEDYAISKQAMLEAMEIFRDTVSEMRRDSFEGTKVSYSNVSVSVLRSIQELLR